jgi:lipoprotein-anchoring transpeptidase ErfK/SrfK
MGREGSGFAVLSHAGKPALRMDDTMSNATPRGTVRESDGPAPSHRRRWPWVVLAVAVAVVAAGVFLAVQNAHSVSLGAFSPAPGAILNSQPVTVTYGLPRFVPGKGTVSLSVDGLALPPQDIVLQPGMVQADISLPDGEHAVALEYESSNLFSRHLARSWTFVVDTVAPEVSVASPASFPLLTARSTDLALDLTEEAVVTLTLDGDGVTVDPAGRPGEPLEAKVVPEEGRHMLALKAIDRAGNVTTKQWGLIVDYKAPAVRVDGISEEDVWNEQNSAAGMLTVGDSFPDELEITARLDGRALILQESQATSAGERAYSFDTGTLTEGTHSIEVSAEDLGGHVTTWKRGFLVDTSSVFGEKTLGAGAIGADVKQLQRILKIKGAYDGDPHGTFDEATAKAVEAFNNAQGLVGATVVTAETLDHLLGSIRIDLSERRLYLYGGGGELAKTYRVAVGMPAYPTPTGTFRIINKEVDPTWNPPDSPWAVGQDPVPPGPGNPLGTRWMGLNSPGIGIHGTYASSSIGKAASHGCIRMLVREAEDLFGRIYVGTPVKIVK